ncbi:hypothetical protein BH11GEM1_BH11GEM1_12130 [soil metagenome]
MNAYLRDKMLQKLETLSDERGYQVLDYIEFLESRYAERATAATGAATGNPLSRFADALEEKLRAGRVSATTIAETMGFMNKAVGVLNGAAAAGKSVASDLMSATNRVVDAATTAATSVAPRPAGADVAGSGTTGARGGAPTGTTGGAGPSSGTAPGAGN